MYFYNHPTSTSVLSFERAQHVPYKIVSESRNRKKSSQSVAAFSKLYYRRVEQSRKRNQGVDGKKENENNLGKKKTQNNDADADKTRVKCE